MPRFRSLPLRALLPVVFVLVAAMWLGVGVLVMPADQPLLARVIGTVLYAGLMTVFFGVLISRARRAAGGVDELSRMQAATKAGAVPPDAEPSTWIPMLEKWQNQNRRARWLSPVAFTGSLALSVWLASTTGWIWLVVSLFFVVALVSSMIGPRRSSARLTRMLRELRSRE